MQGIYEIVNVADGKASSYVGSSNNIQNRFRQHRWFLNNNRHVNPHLQSAWDKWGENAFVFSVLEEVEDGDSLLVLEQEYLDDCFDRGACYNIAKDASAPMRGRPLSPEHRRKVGRKGRPGPWQGKHLSEEHRRKISEANKGRKLSDEQKLTMKRAWKKRKDYKGGKTLRPATLGGVKQKRGVAISKPYPAFYNRNTGEYIPPGKNLLALCRKHGLNNGNMTSVKVGRRPSHKGWVLANTTERRRIKNAFECLGKAASLAASPRVGQPHHYYHRAATA